MNVIIVGGGLFGSIAARLIRARGGVVTVIDDMREEAGSLAAGCVIRPSWASRMHKKQIDSALRILDEFYGLQEIEFVFNSFKSVTCMHVNPLDILGSPVIRGTVISVRDEGKSVVVVLRGGTELRALYVIVAAGIWTELLVPHVKQSGGWGWSFRTELIDKPFISVWAPYRQVVGFNMSDGLGWVGDGTSLLFNKLTEVRKMQSESRCSRRANAAIISSRVGVRPFSRTRLNSPCILEKRGRIIVSTGGGKNGTLAAAWGAQNLMEMIE